MRALYINTCGDVIKLKLFNQFMMIKEVNIEAKKNASQYIMPNVKKIIGHKKIDEVYVVTGPGSFTGVRLGITIAKTYAYLKNIPIKTITTLDEVAVSIKVQQKTVAIKEKNGFFVAKYNGMKVIDNCLYLSNEEFELNKENFYSEVPINYRKVFKYLKSKEKENPHTIKAEYVKTIEALK